MKKAFTLILLLLAIFLVSLAICMDTERSTVSGMITVWALAIAACVAAYFACKKNKINLDKWLPDNPLD